MEKIHYKDFQPYSRPVQSLLVKWGLDPLARLIAWPLINLTSIRPWQVTLLSFLTALAAGWYFYTGAFAFASVLFAVSTILDGVDGYVARIKQNGSAAGIVFDGYTDVLRVLAAMLGLIASGQLDSQMLILFTVFVALHFAESFMDFDFIQVEKFLRKQRQIHLTPFDKSLLRLKDRFEKTGLKLIFFHYQERLFLIFVFGPLFGEIRLFVTLSLVLYLFFFHLKLFFDMSLIKLKLIRNSAEYLRGSGLPNE